MEEGSEGQGLVCGRTGLVKVISSAVEFAVRCLSWLLWRRARVGAQVMVAWTALVGWGWQRGRLQLRLGVRFYPQRLYFWIFPVF